MSTSTGSDERKAKALADYRKRLLEHREFEEKLKQGKFLKTCAHKIAESSSVIMCVY